MIYYLSIGIRIINTNNNYINLLLTGNNNYDIIYTRGERNEER